MTVSSSMHKAVAAALLAAACLPAWAADWTGFRGTGGCAVSQEVGLPVRWGKDEGLRYKVELPGRGLSNPVIAAGRIYLTACTGYREKRLHVLCLEEATGKKLWERQLAATGNTACHPMTNMAAPTPVTDGQAVYALFATGDLAAFGREGAMLWYRSLVSDYPAITNQVGMAASPALAGRVLIVPMVTAGESFVAGLDTATGRNLWKVKRPSDINWVTPVVYSSGGRQTVLYQMGQEATAFDPQTGKVLWKHSAELGSIPSPSQGDGLVFLTGGNARAVRPSAGGSEPEVAWEGPRITGGFASPVYHAGRLYGLSQVALVCLDTATGKEVWRRRVDGPFHASPVIADGKLYAVNGKGKTVVVRLGDGPKVLASNDLDDTILATPAVANGCIYLRSDRYLYCVGPKREN